MTTDTDMNYSSHHATADYVCGKKKKLKCNTLTAAPSSPHSLSHDLWGGVPDRTSSSSSSPLSLRHMKICCLIGRL